MRILRPFVVLLALALTLVPANAQVSPDRLRILIAEIGPVQRLDAEMAQVLMRLANGSVAFDEYAIGQATLEEAIARGRWSMVGAADEIAGFEARIGALNVSPLGDPGLDAMLSEAMGFVRGTPPVLRQILAAVEGQVAAAEIGDFDTVDRISTEMGGIAVVQIDRESAMIKLQLATIDRRHPQHGLSAAWLATNDGMRHLAALSTTEGDKILEVLAAIPDDMRAAGRRMRAEIGRSHAAISEMRARGGQASWLAEVLGLRSAADRELVSHVLDEFEQALAVENRLADLLDHGADLTARLVEGDTGDALMSGFVAFDESYLRLIQERQAEAQDRMRVLQRWQQK